MPTGPSDSSTSLYWLHLHRDTLAQRGSVDLSTIKFKVVSTGGHSLRRHVVIGAHCFDGLLHWTESVCSTKESALQRDRRFDPKIPGTNPLKVC